MTRLKTSLLTIAVLLCSLTASAHDFEVDGIYYNIMSDSDLTVSVTFRGDNYYDYSNEYSGDVTIPEKVIYDSREYSVTSIGSLAFYGCSGLTSVTIPNSVTSMGDSAFKGTGWYNNQSDGVLYLDNWLIGYKGTIPNNTSITIKDGTKGIGDLAFENCSGLTAVTIPNCVMSIGSRAFYKCSDIASIKVESGNIKYDSRDNCNAIIETNTNTLIAGCKNTVIPNSITNIGDYAFYACSGLTSVTIPNSVTSIGERAFSVCSGLTNVTIPNSVTSIGERAFCSCI